MVANLSKDAQTRMNKSVEALQSELAKMRTGRAHSGLLDSVKVNAYGNEMPLSQVASVSVEGARSLTVTPWDKGLTQAIEKAIIDSELGLNPATAGTTIRVPLPSLNEERRKELLRMVKDEGEKARISVRNIRRELNSQVKDMLKAKEIGEDDERRAEADIQKVTDKMVGEIDKLIAAKEKDMMEI